MFFALIKCVFEQNIQFDTFGRRKSGKHLISFNLIQFDSIFFKYPFFWTFSMPKKEESVRNAKYPIRYFISLFHFMSTE